LGRGKDTGEKKRKGMEKSSRVGRGRRGKEKKRMDKILYQYLSLPSFSPQLGNV